jgi:serine-type D-Ala-D-Ala carboxypeptidase/endopeptidase (penicillin-binding protein 4)
LVKIRCFSGLSWALGASLLILAGPAFGAPADAAAKNAKATQARKPAPPVSLDGALAAALRTLQGSSQAVSLSIVEVETRNRVFGFRDDVQMVIASNNKLITSAAALDKLGPDYEIETPFLMRGEIRDGVLEGDLAVVGAGDPNISGRFYEGDSFAVFKTWAAAARQAGIQRVSGNLVLATGYFDDVLIHPDWPRGQLDRWYQAPVSSLSYNDNCVLVKVQPRAGKSAAVLFEPPLPIFQLSGQVAMTANSRHQRVMIGRRLDGDAETQRTYLVGGQIYSKGGKVDEWITVQDPVGYFASGLRQAFALVGIAIDGPNSPVQALPADPSWKKLAAHKSGLQRTLEVLNKRSQNFYAESVIKLLGAKFGGAGTWPAGVAVAKDFLAKVGIAEGSYTMVDGSGLSRSDRFTAAQLTKLLSHMFHHASSSQFARSLPYSGEPELRWERRLAQAPYKGNVLAKTGTLSNVSTLSGYAKGRSGKVYAFSILCNGTHGNSRAMGAQDAVLRALIDRG